MNDTLLEIKWVENNKLPRLHRIMIFIIPQVLYMILYAMKIFEFSIMLILLGLFSSIFSIVGISISNKKQYYKIQLFSDRILIEISNKASYISSQLRTTSKISRGLLMESTNCKISLDFYDIENVLFQETIGYIVFNMKNGQTNMLKSKCLKEEDRNKIIYKLSENRIVAI